MFEKCKLAKVGNFFASYVMNVPSVLDVVNVFSSSILAASHRTVQLERSSNHRKEEGGNTYASNGEEHHAYNT